MSQEVIAEDSLQSAQSFEGEDRVMLFKYCSVLLFISCPIVACLISQE